MPRFIMATREVVSRSVEAAVTGVRHPKWDERPLLIAVRKAGAGVPRDAVLDFLRGNIPKWWMPDDVVFVDEIPHTATGNIHNMALGERFGQHTLPTA